jgi:hypothetical protein
MKKTHIAVLVGIGILIAVLLVFAGDFSSFESIESARRKPGKFVHLITRFDKSQPVQYDPQRDPNFVSFYVLDSLGNQTKVVYHKGKPTDMERSERLVLKGRMTDTHFECTDMKLKCPSKYKEDKHTLEESVQGNTSITQ